MGNISSARRVPLKATDASVDKIETSGMILIYCERRQNRRIAPTPRTAFPRRSQIQLNALKLQPIINSAVSKSIRTVLGTFFVRCVCLTELLRTKNVTLRLLGCQYGMIQNPYRRDFVRFNGYVPEKCSLEKHFENDAIKIASPIFANVTNKNYC